MFRTTASLAGALFWLHAGVLPASSQPAAPQAPVEIIKEAAKSKDAFTFDYAVPGSPALSLLGIDATKVTQSNSLKPFVLSLPSVFGGAEQGQAIALDIAPGWLVVPEEERTYTEYVSSSLRRHLLRTRTGVALYEGSEDAGNPAKSIGSRLALGLSTSWLDDSDPLMARFPGQTLSAWEHCLNRSGEEIDRILQATLPSSLGAREQGALEIQQEKLVRERMEIEGRISRMGDTEEKQLLLAQSRVLLEMLVSIETRLDANTAAARAALRKSYAESKASAEVAKCAKEADRAAKVSRDLDFGIGAIWRGNPGEVSDFEPAGGAVWLSYRHPLLGLKSGEVIDPASKESMKKLDNWWMVGGALRGGVDEFVATGNAATPEIRANTLDAWIGVENNTASRRFSLQVGYQERDPDASAPAGFERSRTRYLASWAQRLGDEESSAWLNVSFGDAQGNGAYQDDDTLLVSLVFAPPDPRRIFGAP